MILSELAFAALIIGVATGPLAERSSPTFQELSLHQKNAVMRPYLRSATECIARTVAADTRFRRKKPRANLGDLIVDSMPQCIGPVRALIDAYDRNYGEGAGEAFFMGPYLDVLPSAVSRLTSDMAD